MLIATTHLKAKAGAENSAMRMLQAKQLMDSLQEASCTITKDESGTPADATTTLTRVPIILCGDFNAEPTTEEIVYIVEHPLGLRSVWPLTAPLDTSWSTWKFRTAGEKKAQIDYIWHSEAQVQPVSRWQVPDQAEVGTGALPSAVYPSDHISLFAELQLK